MAAHSWLELFLAFFRLRFDEENGQDLFLLPGITKAHRSRVNFACVLIFHMTEPVNAQLSN